MCRDHGKEIAGPSKTIELTDEQYSTLQSIAARDGETPQHLDLHKSVVDLLQRAGLEFCARLSGKEDIKLHPTLVVVFFRITA